MGEHLKRIVFAGPEKKPQVPPSYGVTFPAIHRCWSQLADL
jgi:hypothetical protein